MLEVSQAWIDNQTKDLTSESLVRVRFYLTDKSYVLGRHLINIDCGKMNRWHFFPDTREPESEVTAECGRWILNGSCNRFNREDNTDRFYIACRGSELSDDYGRLRNTVFEASMQDRRGNRQVVKTPGVTLVWDKMTQEYPHEFTIEYFRGGISIKRHTVIEPVMPKDCTVKIIDDDPTLDFDTVKITPKKWCAAGHYARLHNFYPGLIEEFGKQDIMRLSLEEHANLKSFEAPSSRLELTLNVLDYDKRLIPFYRHGVKLEVEVGYKLNQRVEWIPLGSYEVADARFNENKRELDIQAVPSLCQEGDLWLPLRQGLFEDFEVKTHKLSELASIISGEQIESTDLSYDYVIKARNDTTLPALPDTRKRIEWLQLIGNMCGMCTSLSRKTGGIKFSQVSDVARMHDRPVAILAKQCFSRPVIAKNQGNKRLMLAVEELDIDLSKPTDKKSTKAYEKQTEAVRKLVFVGESRIVTVNERHDYCIKRKWNAKVVKGNPLSKIDYDACKALYKPFDSHFKVRTTEPNVWVEITMEGLTGETVSYGEVLLDEHATGEEVNIKNEVAAMVAPDSTFGSMKQDNLAKLKEAALLYFNKWTDKVSLDFRYDPAIEVGDMVLLEIDGQFKKFAIETLNVDYTGGAFHGRAEGRLIP